MKTHHFSFEELYMYYFLLCETLVEVVGVRVQLYEYVFLHSEFPNPLLHVFRRIPCPSWCVAIQHASKGAQGVEGRGRVLPTPSLSPPHPWESLLACYLLLYQHLSSSLSLFQHIFVSFVTISPVSSFQGHVVCQSFTLTVPPLAVVGTIKQIHPPEGQLTKGSNAHYSTLQEPESPVGIL